MRLEIIGEASAGLLCRLVGFAAQLDLAAPAMQVSVAAGEMTIAMDLEDVNDSMGAILAEKMRRCIGVEAVALRAKDR